MSATAVPSATVSAQSVPQSMTDSVPTVPVTLPFAGAATVRVRAVPNAAPTVLSASIVRSQRPRPEQSPVHAPSALPASGVAVSVTLASSAKSAAQSLCGPPQLMPLPAMRPLDGLVAISRCRVTLAMVTLVPTTGKAVWPWAAVPPTATVSLLSSTVSSTGVSTNVPVALREPDGIAIGKSETGAKSSVTVAVPPATLTVTVLATAATDVPVSVAVTCSVSAPPSSATLALSTLSTTLGTHSASSVPPTSPWSAFGPCATISP